MGGSFDMFQQLTPPVYQQQQFSNDQIFQTAKSADQAMKDAYNKELLAQLRAGSYKTPEGVYSNIMNAQAQQKQMNDYNAKVAEQQAAQQAAEQAAQGDQGGWYTG